MYVSILTTCHCLVSGNIMRINAFMHTNKLSYVGVCPLGAQLNWRSLQYFNMIDDRTQSISYII